MSDVRNPDQFKQYVPILESPGNYWHKNEDTDTGYRSAEGFMEASRPMVHTDIESARALYTHEGTTEVFRRAPRRGGRKN